MNSCTVVHRYCTGKHLPDYMLDLYAVNDLQFCCDCSHKMQIQWGINRTACVCQEGWTGEGKGTRGNKRQWWTSVRESVRVLIGCPIIRHCNVMSSSSESSCIYSEPVCVHGPTTPPVWLYKVLVKVSFSSLELPDWTIMSHDLLNQLFIYSHCGNMLLVDTNWQNDSDWFNSGKCGWVKEVGKSILPVWES